MKHTTQIYIVVYREPTENQAPQQFKPREKNTRHTDREEPTRIVLISFKLYRDTNHICIVLYHPCSPSQYRDPPSHTPCLFFVRF